MKARFEFASTASPRTTRALTMPSRARRHFYEATAQRGSQAAPEKARGQLGPGEVAAALNKADLDILASPVSAARLAGLLTRVADGTISGKIAKDVFDAMWAGEARERPTRSSPRRAYTDFGCGAIGRIVDGVIAANPVIVAEFRAGKEKAFNSLVGKAMQATKGKANPAQVNAVLKKKLG